MAITPLPDAPQRSDTPDVFIPKADAFIAALGQFVTEANALAAALNLNSTTDTSATSNSIGTGSKSFTVSTGKSFQPGMFIVIADTAAPSTNSMTAQVTSYNSGTGALVVDVKGVLGSGTKTAWTISQTANPIPLDLSVTFGKLNAALISAATEDTAPDEEADFLLSSDTSASGLKKVLPRNINIGPQRIYNLVGFVASANTFRIKADGVLVRNPTTGKLAAIGSFDVTSSNLTSVQGASAANGRDQSATFSAGWIYGYIIWGDGQTDATLWSTSASSPTLPTGYTHWARAVAGHWNGTQWSNNFGVQGNWHYYYGAVSVLTGGSATTETSVTLTSAVPPASLAYKIRAAGTITADGSANYDVTLSLRFISGTDHHTLRSPYKAASASAGNMPTWLGVELEMPSAGGTLALLYLHTVTVGSSPSTTLQVTGYKFPNGAE